MTDKERLKSLKRNKEWTEATGEKFYTVDKRDYEWLIKQAERVQELEEEIRRIRQMKYHEAYEQGKFDTNMKVWYEMKRLEQQNKRYREALEFYANEDNWVYGKVQHILRGEKARKALEGEE